MAVTNSSLLVTWAAAASGSIAASGGVTESDAATFNANTYSAMVQCQATGTSGDTVDFYAELAPATAPDGSSAAVYDTVRIFLGSLTIGAAAVAFDANLPVNVSCKIYAEGGAANAGISTVSAIITEYKSA